MSRFPHIQAPPDTERDWFQALIDLARYLRSPDGCPWDREQSSSDFVRFLQEEAAELAEAADSDDADHFAEELGDTLFTLLAAVAAAEEEGLAEMETILQRIHDKMIRRHEHVFGDAKAETPEDAMRVWNAVKAREKGGGTESG